MSTAVCTPVGVFQVVAVATGKWKQQLEKTGLLVHSWRTVKCLYN